MLYNKILLLNKLHSENYFSFNKLKILMSNFFSLSKKCFFMITQNKYMLFKNSYDFKIFALFFNRSNHFKTITRIFKFYFFTEFFDHLWIKLEETIYIYLNYKYDIYFLPNLFLFYKPYLSSSKLLCDYIFFCLKKRFRVNKIYKTIKR